MRANQPIGYSTKLVVAWLTFRVHIDAFRFNPGAYLTAARWWIKRRRVRARGQFAPLLSQSPVAYRLWMLRQDRAGEGAGAIDGQLPIVALVDATGNATCLATTLRSLSVQGIAAEVIGSGETPDLTSALARIDWNAKPWLMPIVAGDRVAPNAAAAYRAILAGQNASARLLYADDDVLDRRSRRITPHFKPDWNSELFRHFDYLTGACIVQAAREDMPEGRPDWAETLVARMAGQGTPVHVRQMLHHRRKRIMPLLPAAPAILSHDLPPVTVIVPTR